MLLSQLPQKGNDSHSCIFVSIRQVDLIAKHNKPFARLFRSQHNSTDSFVVLAVVFELLHDESWVGR